MTKEASAAVCVVCGAKGDRPWAWVAGVGWVCGDVCRRNAPKERGGGAEKTVDLGEPPKGSS